MHPKPDWNVRCLRHYHHLIRKHHRRFVPLSVIAKGLLWKKTG